MRRSGAIRRRRSPWRKACSTSDLRPLRAAFGWDLCPSRPTRAASCGAAMRNRPSRNAVFCWENLSESVEHAIFDSLLDLRRSPFMTVVPVAPSRSLVGDWRRPALIVLCGCLISVISFGPRSSLGFFLTPQSQANGWGRDVFGLALAAQNILWGLGPAYGGHPGGSLRGGAGIVCRGHPICPRSGDHGVCNNAADPRSLGRMSHRLWACRMLVRHRACGFRQALAGTLAIARLRCRHGRGLIRAIPLRAAYRVAHR